MTLLWQVLILPGLPVARGIVSHRHMRVTILLWPYSFALFLAKNGAGYGFGPFCGRLSSALHRYMLGSIIQSMYLPGRFSALLWDGLYRYYLKNFNPVSDAVLEGSH